MGKELNRISRNGKHSHNLASRLDVAEERVSKLKNAQDDKISEDTRWEHPNCNKERQKNMKKNLRYKGEGWEISKQIQWEFWKKRKHWYTSRIEKGYKLISPECNKN